MRLNDAGREEMEQVLKESHAVWGEGMSLDAYLALNLALKDSAWGRQHYRFLLGQDDRGEVQSSMKLYSLRGRLDGRPVRIAGVGAVFTPADRRGRGHAAELLHQALATARSEGHAVALLVSEIGEAFYARQGFRCLPSTETACRSLLPVQWPKEPAWLKSGETSAELEGLRAFRPGDLDALIRIHDFTTDGGRFAIQRDRPAWRQILLKMELRHRLRREAEDRLFVIDRGSGVEAYAILRATSGTLRWREHGARRGSEERLVDLFWSAIAWARREGMERLEGWFLPAAVTDTSIYPVARRRRAEPVVMIRALDRGIELPEFSREEDCQVWELDAF